MSKQIIWVHGEKGGVGKSLMASIAIDWLLKNERETCLIDGDGSFPDVFRRFSGNKKVPANKSPIVSPDSVTSMLENLEEEFKDVPANHTLVVNLPSNTSVLDNVSSDVLELTEALGYENYTIYMVADDAESKNTAMQSMKTGIVSISKRSVAVLNDYFTNKRNSDNSWVNSTEEALWKDNGNRVATLPILNERAKSVANFADKSFEYLVHDDPVIHKIHAIYINKWLRAGYDVMETLDCLGGEDIVSYIEQRVNEGIYEERDADA